MKKRPPRVIYKTKRPQEDPIHETLRLARDWHWNRSGHYMNWNSSGVWCRECGWKIDTEELFPEWFPR